MKTELEHPNIEIVSHPLCPHAQRCRLVLLRKGLEQGADFTMRYVDLADTPAWFRELSPEGRMPVVLIEGSPFFDSSTVAEYFDEALPSRLLPAELLQRLRQRDAIAEADVLLTLLKGVFTAQTHGGVEEAVVGLFERLRVLECSCEQFGSERLSMVDVAFAPFFSLVLFHEWLAERPEWNSVPLVRGWGERLVSDEDVAASRCENYAEEFEHFFGIVGSAFAGHVRSETNASRGREPCESRA